MTFDPYAVLRERPDVTVVWNAAMPERGRWYDRLRTMLIREGLTEAERRCTVAHEGVHLERGDTDCNRSVHAEAARRLISIERLGDVLLWTSSPHEAADELWVDVDTLQVRLDHLHPAERGYLRQCLDTKESTA